MYLRLTSVAACNANDHLNVILKANQKNGVSGMGISDLELFVGLSSSTANISSNVDFGTGFANTPQHGLKVSDKL